MNTFLSKLLCGFRKGINCQYALLNMIRQWQNHLSDSGKVGAILMDLSKAFDCLPHDLLIAKLTAYGFGYKTLKLFYSYLSDRKHRARLGSSLSDWLCALLGVPQGSVLGPILFNIFINDLILTIRECSICNFADDNTLYSMDTTLEAVLSSLRSETSNVIGWFNSNGMVANPTKFQMIILGADSSNVSIQINDTIAIKPEKEVKLLGITLDEKLSFYPHVRGICKQVSNKTKALHRIRKLLNPKQLNIIFNTFILPHFNYCPLIWMFCSKQAHNLLQSSHRRALCAKTGLFGKTYQEILSASGISSIHSTNLKNMIIEVFKSLHHLNPEFMWKIFKVKSSKYSLRCGRTLEIPCAKKNVGINSFQFRACLAWNELPIKIKEIENLQNFKAAIKSHKDPIYCQCKLCSAQ